MYASWNSASWERRMSTGFAPPPVFYWSQGLSFFTLPDVKQIFHAHPPGKAKASLGPTYREFRHGSLSVYGTSLVGGRSGRSQLL